MVEGRGVNLARDSSISSNELYLLVFVCHQSIEVVWAPLLLMHLGGQDCITAYNIEDNELWMRHVLTAVSQITVAIFSNCMSVATEIFPVTHMLQLRISTYMWVATEIFQLRLRRNEEFPLPCGVQLIFQLRLRYPRSRY
jgi:hypothetical protein